MYTARDFFGTDRLTFSLVSIVPNQPDATVSTGASPT